jgi:hypothetical protein
LQQSNTNNGSPSNTRSQPLDKITDSLAGRATSSADTTINKSTSRPAQGKSIFTATVGDLTSVDHAAGNNTAGKLFDRVGAVNSGITDGEDDKLSFTIDPDSSSSLVNRGMGSRGNKQQPVAASGNGGLSRNSGSGTTSPKKSIGGGSRSTTGGTGSLNGNAGQRLGSGGNRKFGSSGLGGSEQGSGGTGGGSQSGGSGSTGGGSRSGGSGKGFGSGLDCLANCRPSYPREIEYAVVVSANITLNDSGQVIATKLSQPASSDDLNNFAQNEFSKMKFRLPADEPRRNFIVELKFKETR